MKIKKNTIPCMNIKINWRTLFDEDDAAQMNKQVKTVDSLGQWPDA